MEELTLIILAEDIKNTEYTDPWNCAIAKALNRAGYPQGYDGIGYISLGVGFKHIFWKDTSNYSQLSDKVCGMYLFMNNNRKFDSYIEPIEPKDFEFTLKQTSVH